MDIFFSILYFLLVLVFTIAFIGIAVAWICVMTNFLGSALKRGWRTLQRLCGPRCPACRARALDWYDRDPYFHEWRDTYYHEWFEVTTPARTYYCCLRCTTQFRRRGDIWERLPEGAQTQEEMKARMTRTACIMVRNYRSVSTDPCTSWFGRVQVALPDEEWPTCEGVPMLPLCQIRLSEVPRVPSELQEFALLCIFAACASPEVMSPTAEGERWCVRAYRDLSALVPVKDPGEPDRIAAFPVVWHESGDFPDTAIRNLLSEMDRLDMIRWARKWADSRAKTNRELIKNRLYFECKIGGWRIKPPAGDTDDRDVPLEPLLQITNSPIQWTLDLGGVFAFHRTGEEGARTWSLDWAGKALEAQAFTLLPPFGFERDGVSFHRHRSAAPPGISYQGKYGLVRGVRDLRGFVHIRNPIQALDYARQVMRWDLYEHQEEVRYPDQEIVIIEKGADRRPTYQVSAEEFRRWGLTPAEAVREEDHFCVTRWIWKDAADGYDKFGNEAESGAQKIRETIGAGGSYSRLVLERRGPLPQPNELLVPAAAPAAAPEELLRPASESAPSDPDELLRPTPTRFQ